MAMPAIRSHDGYRDTVGAQGGAEARRLVWSGAKSRRVGEPAHVVFVMFLKFGVSFGSGTAMSALLQEDLVHQRQAIARSEFMASHSVRRRATQLG
jgi:hypothetical protein